MKIIDHHDGFGLNDSIEIEASDFTEPRLAEAKPTAIEVKPPSLVDEIAFIRRVISPALADVYAKTMLGSDAVREYGAAVPIPAVPPGEKSE